MSSASSKNISYSAQKLIIHISYPTGYILAAIVFLLVTDASCGINLAINLPISFIDESRLIAKSLNSSKLICNRTTDEVSCSLTGTSLFGNVEKAINSKYGRLIKVDRKSTSIISDREPNGVSRYVVRDDLLVLITEKEEITIYTSPDLLSLQQEKLRSFLEDKTQSEVVIQTKKLSDFSFLSSFSHSHYIIITTTFIYTLIFLCLAILIGYKLNAKTYIFDNESAKLSILRTYNRDLLFEISLQRIKEIYLEKEKEITNKDLQIDVKPVYKIHIYDEMHSLLLSIYFEGSEISADEVHEIANSICSFLGLESYKTIDNSQ
ncbi:hypothetical protein V2H45_17990 [Tumidithrix elongata RA019]|uniref:Uncharacterized protein n=1 Tax=Tumidithrix elongata BACA0141 TaxID=2716417 RepID=A0AAW9Q6R9_9CYAN|nr:hypothetical protein [Tumidithrix elongata RA019]